MDESNTKIKFEKALDSLERIEGVEGTLVVDNHGEILYNSLLAEDVSLFGSMANIISNASENLLDSSKQGLSERILVESKHGNALFINLEKAHFVVLTRKSTNLGMVMIASKSAGKIIKEMPEIKEIELIEFVEEEVPSLTSEIAEEPAMVKEESVAETTIPPAEITASPVETEITSETQEIGKIEETEITAESLTPDESAESQIVESAAPVTENVAETATAEIKSVESGVIEEISKPSPVEMETPGEDISKTPTIPGPEVSELREEATVTEEILETVAEEKKEKEEKEEKGPVLPVIRPPLAFPPLPENVEIPEDLAEKTDLIISIYETLLLAMSIGASKIMGFAPARGMLVKSLPYEKCPDILKDVNVKSNSALEFDKIRVNLDQLPLESQVEKAIQDFTTIISAITDNYGKVMGYDAFRGMIRPEFKKIYNSYGSAMEELGIKEKIHPELRELLVN